jgi:hypothetical protein
MEDSALVAPNTKSEGRSDLVGSLLDGFLERAVARVSQGKQGALLSESPEYEAMSARADEAVSILFGEESDEDLTADQAEEIVRSLERARREPVLRELAIANWNAYFRPSVSPQTLHKEILSKFRAGLEHAPNADARRQAEVRVAKEAVFLASLTSQLKTRLEKIFRYDPTLDWMSRW